MSQTTFIYALCEPGTRTVRYIGKSDDPKRRLSEHLLYSGDAHSHKNYWLLSLLARGALPELIVLSEISSLEWQAEEIRFISAARCLGIRLTNATDGGEGGNNPSPEARVRMSVAQLGKKATLETREKMSIAHQNPSRETREKLSVSRRGKQPNLGKHHSIETRAKISAANRERKCPPETRAKIGAAQTGEKNHNYGKKASVETRSKMSAAQLGRVVSEETRANMREAWKLRKLKRVTS